MRERLLLYVWERNRGGGVKADISIGTYMPSWEEGLIDGFRIKGAGPVEQGASCLAGLLKRSMVGWFWCCRVLEVPLCKTMTNINGLMIGKACLRERDSSCPCKLASSHF